PRKRAVFTGHAVFLFPWDQKRKVENNGGPFGPGVDRSESHPGDCGPLAILSGPGCLECNHQSVQPPGRPVLRMVRAVPMGAAVSALGHPDAVTHGPTTGQSASFAARTDCRRWKIYGSRVSREHPGAGQWVYRVARGGHSGD